MHRQMECRVLDGLQGCQHGFLIPDGTLLVVCLGCFTGQGNLVDQVPFHCIGKGGFQQGVDFVNGGAGQHRFFCLSVRVCFTPWTYCPQGVLARVA